MTPSSVVGTIASPQESKIVADSDCASSGKAGAFDCAATASSALLVISPICARPGSANPEDARTGPPIWGSNAYAMRYGAANRLMLAVVTNCDAPSAFLLHPVTPMRRCSVSDARDTIAALTASIYGRDNEAPRGGAP